MLNIPKHPPQNHNQPSICPTTNIYNKKIFTMKTGLKKFSLLLAASFAFGTTAYCQPGLKMESVSIFKNSSAFFVKSGQVTTKDKKWEVVGDTIPKALEGSFWIGSPSNELSIVKSFLQDKEVSGLVSYYSDMLLANDGKRIRLMRAGDSVWVEGKVKVLQMKNPDPTKPDIKSSTLFAITQSSGATAMLTVQQVNNAKSMEFLDTPNFTNSSIQRLPVMQAHFTSTKAQQPINLMYLSNGLSWKPEYKIELLEETKARLSLQTIIVNEAEDIEVAKLNLVAGVPNFKYATGISDFLNLLGQNAYNYATRAIAQNFMNTAVPRNEAIYDPEFILDMPDPNPAPRPAEGTAIEDLFYYTLNDVIIKKGERAMLDIFSAEIPVEHVYEVVLGVNSVSYTTTYSFEQRKLPVVHTLKLKNNSSYVWTAASAMVVKNDKGKISPISQDLLKYTSLKDDVNVKLTEAPDVAVKFTEKEISREVNKKSVKESNNRMRYYDLVTVEAEVEIQNFKAKDIRIDSKRATIGKLLNSSETWLLAPRLQNYDSYNPYTDVCWELNIKSGETKKITYKYEIYVTHY